MQIRSIRLGPGGLFGAGLAADDAAVEVTTGLEPQEPDRGLGLGLHLRLAVRAPAPRRHQEPPGILRERPQLVVGHRPERVPVPELPGLLVERRLDLGEQLVETLRYDLDPD